MAIGLVIQLQGIGADKYDAVMRELGLDRAGARWPAGMMTHIAGATAQGWCVVDVWQSREDFDTFLAEQLGPALERVGGIPRPDPIELQIYNVHEPALVKA